MGDIYLHSSETKLKESKLLSKWKKKLSSNNNAVHMYTNLTVTLQVIFDNSSNTTEISVN